MGNVSVCRKMVSRWPAFNLAKAIDVATTEVTFAVFEFPKMCLRGAALKHVVHCSWSEESRIYYEQGSCTFMKSVHVQLPNK